MSSACLPIAAAAVLVLPAAAQLPPDQLGYIAYDRCIMHAAIKASHTDAKDADIFALAMEACAETRIRVTLGQEGNADYLRALDAADAEKAATFPAWIAGVRARRLERAATPR